jgi:integrase
MPKLDGNILTYSDPLNMITQDQLKSGGIIVKGIIICNKCRKKMSGVCLCGGYKCLIKIYWKGKSYEYRRDDQGYIFTYDRACDKLIEISTAIKAKSFNPVNYTDAKLKELRFENQVEKWLQEKETQEAQRELSPGTTRQYKGYVQNYYTFFHGEDIRDIELEQLTNFKDTLLKVSIKTRKNIMIALHGFFKWLKERGIIKELPMFPKIKGDDSKATRAIGIESQSEALQRVPAQHRGIYEFLMDTGLRPGEVCALLVENIDMEQSIARIDRTFSGSILRDTTKQKKKRIIPLSDKALQIVQYNIPGKLPKQYLFINPYNGNHYNVNRLEKIWNKYSGTDLTLYEATRHSFATQMIQNNDVSIVKELMGHSDIRTTQKYLHTKMDKLNKAVNSRGVIFLQNKTEIELKKGDEINPTITKSYK